MIGLVISLILMWYLNFTNSGRRFMLGIKQRFLYWKYTKYFPWFKAHQGHWFFKYLEHANWFKWYGRKVIHVKSKDPSKLSVTEKDLKNAINAKDYKKALDIVNELPFNKKTLALKQFIESKLQ